MPRSLEWPDGYRVGTLEPVTSGQSHHVYFGVAETTGEAVAVKAELLPGRLAVEHRALSWLDASGVAVPAVRAFGRCRLDGRDVPCLVTGRVLGQPPASEQAWHRMGQRLGRLAAVAWEGSGLPVCPAAEFAASHRDKAAVLAGPLAALGEHDAVRRLRTEPVPPLGRLILTHGDPGGGNYLETAAAGYLLDWENAQVAPRGLDLARSAFIALLDAARAGRPADFGKARAVTTGYLSARDWQPEKGELRWWLGVAGVQFVHNRWRRAGQPRVLPWADAARVLARALSDDTWLA